jgi:hypothetical protein
MNICLLQRDEILLIWQIDRSEIDPGLFAPEPEDIHLEFVIS